MHNVMRKGLSGAALLLLVACGGQSGTGGGGGPTAEATPLATPVSVPADFFENGAKQVGVLVTGTAQDQPTALLVGTDGHVLVTQSWSGQSVSHNLPGALTTKFFQDLAAARPVENHPAGTCDQGVWGGDAQLYVSLGGHPSADLFCPGDAQATAVRDDVLAIFRTLNITPAPRGTPAPGNPSPAASAPGGANR